MGAAPVVLCTNRRCPRCTGFGKTQVETRQVKFGLQPHQRAKTEGASLFGDADRELVASALGSLARPIHEYGRRADHGSTW